MVVGLSSCCFRLRVLHYILSTIMCIQLLFSLLYIPLHVHNYLHPVVISHSVHSTTIPQLFALFTLHDGATFAIDEEEWLVFPVVVSHSVHSTTIPQLFALFALRDGATFAMDEEW